MGKSTLGNNISCSLTQGELWALPPKNNLNFAASSNPLWYLLCFLSPQLIDYCSCDDDRVNYRDFLLAFPSNLFPEAEGQDQQMNSLLP